MAEHAGLIAERFGDLVDEWCTLNEPINYLFAGYGIGFFPPGKTAFPDLDTKFVPVVKDYVAAHAEMSKAIKAADTIDADGDGGRVGDVRRRAGDARQQAVARTRRHRGARSHRLRVSPRVRRLAVQRHVRSGSRRHPRRGSPRVARHARLARAAVLLPRRRHRKVRADPADRCHALLRRLRSRFVPARRRAHVLRATHGLRGLPRRHR